VKVTIRDKDALTALSWVGLKTYLESKGWKPVDDISDKAVVYQRRVKKTRYWEILVPLRTDLADYAARMGDAVRTLGRVEDRSELDVYEDLRRLGAGSSPIDDATRTVHEKIRRWLAEEGWHVRNVDDPQASFNVMVTLHNGEGVNVFQYLSHHDHLTISRHAILDERSRLSFAQLPEPEKREIGRQIYRDMSVMGLEVEDLESHPLEMRYGLTIYFDALNKDAFIQRVLLVLRANALSLRTLADALNDAGQTDRHTIPRLQLVS
jgi:hypothetical protein